MEKIKQEILNLFKKSQLKQGQPLDPAIWDRYLKSSTESRTLIGDAVDDLINKALIIETRTQNKPAFALTRHGEEVLYR